MNASKISSVKFKLFATPESCKKSYSTNLDDGEHAGGIVFSFCASYNMN